MGDRVHLDQTGPEFLKFLSPESTPTRPHMALAIGNSESLGEVAGSPKPKSPQGLTRHFLIECGEHLLLLVSTCHYKLIATLSFAVKGIDIRELREGV